MDEYKIYFRESVEKDTRLIPKNDVIKILQKIKFLSNQPGPEGCEKLTD
jgi:mRNA interferase RelE/StbE